MWPNCREATGGLLEQRILWPVNRVAEQHREERTQPWAQVGENHGESSAIRRSAGMKIAHAVKPPLKLSVLAMHAPHRLDDARKPYSKGTTFPR